LGVASLEIILANLLFSFDWELPHGLVVEDIDDEMLTQEKPSLPCCQDPLRINASQCSYSLLVSCII
jgi:hypothetical protein